MAGTTNTTTTGTGDQQLVMLCDGQCDSCSVPYVYERDNCEPVSFAYCGEPIDLTGPSVTARRPKNF